MLDNRHVVPYNAYLLKRFGCHINVEKVSSLHAVKYLHKYIHKGPPRIEMTTVNKQLNSDTNSIDKYEYDEIARHQDFRYLCPAESVWHILGFHMQGMILK